MNFFFLRENSFLNSSDFNVTISSKNALDNVSFAYFDIFIYAEKPVLNDFTFQINFTFPKEKIFYFFYEKKKNLEKLYTCLNMTKGLYQSISNSQLEKIELATQKSVIATTGSVVSSASAFVRGLSYANLAISNLFLTLKFFEMHLPPNVEEYYKTSFDPFEFLKNELPDLSMPINKKEYQTSGKFQEYNYSNII